MKNNSSSLYTDSSFSDYQEQAALTKLIIIREDSQQQIRSPEVMKEEVDATPTF